MKEKEQSSIEWLIDNLKENRNNLAENIFEIILSEAQLESLIELSKEIHKKEIEDAYYQGHEDGYHFIGSVSDYEVEGLENYLSEQYYTEKYGQ